MSLSDTDSDTDSLSLTESDSRRLGVRQADISIIYQILNVKLSCSIMCTFSDFLKFFIFLHFKRLYRQLCCFCYFLASAVCGSRSVATGS